MDWMRLGTASRVGHIVAARTALVAAVIAAALAAQDNFDEALARRRRTSAA